MRSDELDFVLPPELIAQHPSEQRSASRLLHYRRHDASMQHRRFAELPELLREGDVLVFNNSKVLPAKFLLEKPSRGRVEGLFLEELGQGRWRVLLKNLGNAKQLRFIGSDIQIEVKNKYIGGEYEIRIDPAQAAEEILATHGRMPLPPYIKRAKERDDRDEMDRRRYQTVYADLPGSVAAPTAGLHFTQELLEQLRHRGVQQQFITLHVGMGTFKPLTTDLLEEHAMHSESYSISAETAQTLNQAKKENRRIIAVGTTVARVLESQSTDGFAAKSDSTRIFIYPPYTWKNVSAMITNFHLPRSTLIALVAALAGLREQRRIYAEAIRQKYRFFSYGDAMFVE